MLETQMSRGMTSRQWFNVFLLFASTAFAWAIHVLENAAAGSPRWNRYVFPDLGPELSGLAATTILILVPGIPFLFAAAYSVRASRPKALTYRISLSCLILVLGLVTFKDISFMLWMLISILYGGKF